MSSRNRYLEKSESISSCSFVKIVTKYQICYYKTAGSYIEYVSENIFFSGGGSQKHDVMTIPSI